MCLRRHQQIAEANNASSTHHRQDSLGRSLREHLGSGDLVTDPAVLQESPEGFLVRGFLREVQLIQHGRSASGRDNGKCRRGTGYELRLWRSRISSFGRGLTVRIREPEQPVLNIKQWERV